MPSKPVSIQSRGKEEEEKKVDGTQLLKVTWKVASRARTTVS